MWSKQHEYREPRNDDNSQFSCMFVFEKASFESDEFQQRAMNLLIDNRFYLNRMEKLYPDDREKQRKEISEVICETSEEFRYGLYPCIHFHSSPFSPENEGYFVMPGDSKPRAGKPHLFFKKLGYRSVEFTNQILLEKMKDYDYVQALIAFFKKVFATLEPIFGYLDTYDYVYSMKQKDPREYVFGLTFYGKEMVEQIGREKLLNAPVYKVEEFDHGGIMLQIHENPVSYIRWPLRRKIIDYLGLKDRSYDKPRASEKQKISDWLANAKPSVEVSVPKKKETMVVVGSNADELELEEDFSLFNYFRERILPEGKRDPKPEFAFAKWFNDLETGLKAFISGNMYEKKFKVFVGEKVCGLQGFESWHREVDPEKVRKAESIVKKRFEELGFREKPFINFLDYHVEGD